MVLCMAAASFRSFREDCERRCWNWGRGDRTVERCPSNFERERQRTHKDRSNCFPCRSELLDTISSVGRLVKRLPQHPPSRNDEQERLLASQLGSSARRGDLD